MSDAAEPSADPHLMDRIYRRQRHVYDPTRKFFLLGRDRLIAELKPPSGGSVLEIGCGTGRNLVAAARSYRDVSLHGLDVSSAMLTTARAGIRRAGLEGRVRLALGDATSFDPHHLFGRASFDRVFLSYSLSMIPDWRAALEQTLKVVEPQGGRLLVVDFGGQDRLPEWFKSLLLAWLARFHVTPRQDLGTTLADIAKRDHAELRFRSLFRDYARFIELARGSP